MGGQKSLRPIWENYFEANDALIYVIDSSDTYRLEESGKELRMLLEENEIDGIGYDRIEELQCFDMVRNRLRSDNGDRLIEYDKGNIQNRLIAFLEMGEKEVFLGSR